MKQAFFIGSSNFPSLIERLTLNPVATSKPNLMHRKLNPLSSRRRVDPTPVPGEIGSLFPISESLSGSVESFSSVESVYTGFPNPRSEFPTGLSRG
jgi:hypothetical protein